MPRAVIAFGEWRLWKGAPVVVALFSCAVPAQETSEVRIEAYQFRPPEVRVHAGDSVRWVNREKRTSHSVLFPAEGGLESERLFPDESWERRFEKAGRYDYHCGPHPEMKGVVLVD
ncbi:MAG TPA: plastocyanin/azurin family copper-binding protein [Azonexus sp.]|nr:plastocyanin/azurin family copper-binding protein [Azonexus sp.]